MVVKIVLTVSASSLKLTTTMTYAMIITSKFSSAVCTIANKMIWLVMAIVYEYSTQVLIYAHVAPVAHMVVHVLSWGLISINFEFIKKIKKIE